jgi:hypothetical protein
VFRAVVATAAIAAFVVGVSLTIERFQIPARPLDPGQEIVATVDQEPVYAVDVGPHVRPQRPWVGPTAPIDPVDSALRDAIVIRLVAAEARRQGLAPPNNGERSIVDGQLVQALINKELAAKGLGAHSITAEQARTFFDAHRADLSQFRGASVSAVVVTDLGTAKRVLAAAATASAEQFKALVDQHSVDAASKARAGHAAVVDAAADNLPLDVARVVVSTKRDGDVGLADTRDGRFWVVRVSAVRLDLADWNAAMEHRIRQLLLSEQRGTVLADLESRLRPAAEVEIDQRALDRFRARVAEMAPPPGPG